MPRTGSKSPVRDRLGIPLRGHPSFSNSITIYFRADVKPLVGDRNLSVIYVFGPTLQGFFRFSLAGDAGFLVVNTTTDVDGARDRDVWAELDDERCAAYVREALGAPDLALEIENVQRWNACAEWADRFADGRVFLAGDAAHNMPPTGGFGGNTGVADGHNLAWKVAHVLHGDAGPGLLKTYDAERRPVGEFTTEQAYTRYVMRLDPELGKEDIQPFVPDPPIELGHRYRSVAVISEADDDGSIHENPLEPSGRPGTRAPHVVSRRRLDARPLRSRLRRPLASGRMVSGGGGGLTRRPSDRGAGVRGAYGTGTEGAVLVRPDGFIAWRAVARGRTARASCPRHSRGSSTASRAGRAGRPRPPP